MHRATSNTSAGVRQACLRAGLGAAVLTMTAGIAAPAIIADTVVAKQQRAAVVATQQREAATDMTRSQQQVQTATDRLLRSQGVLDAARGRLAEIRGELQQARAYDRRLAAELATAQAELRAARAATAAGQKRVQAQRHAMGRAARDAYQQHNDYLGVSVMFGSQTSAELSQRLQWNTTIFDAESRQKERLDSALVQLRESQARQSAIEKGVAADKAAAAAQVTVIGDLESSAAAQAATVAQLVAANQRNRTAAQGELDADEARYRRLSSEETRLQREIRVQIAAEREAARQRAIAEARRRAAQQARGPRDTAAAASASASSERVSGRVAVRASGESQRGFVMPVNATPGSSYGPRFHPILRYWRMHNGTDFGARCGAPLYAVAEGRVLTSGSNGGFGNFVAIGHGVQGGRYVTTGYAHQSGVVVRAGQRVRQGQLIGYVGTTGLSTGCHLHFEVRLDGAPTNPLAYLP